MGLALEGKNIWETVYFEQTKSNSWTHSDERVLEWQNPLHKFFFAVAYTGWSEGNNPEPFGYPFTT